jgi:hypothetical protein
MFTSSTDIGMALHPAFERIGRLEGDHRVMQERMRQMRGAIGRLSGELKEMGKALSAEKRDRLKADQAIRAQINQGLWWMMVAAGGLGVLLLKGDSAPIIALIKARLGL